MPGDRADPRPDRLDQGRAGDRGQEYTSLARSVAIETSPSSRNRRINEEKVAIEPQSFYCACQAFSKCGGRDS